MYYTFSEIRQTGKLNFFKLVALEVSENLSLRRDVVFLGVSPIYPSLRAESSSGRGPIYPSLRAESSSGRGSDISESESLKYFIVRLGERRPIDYEACSWV